MPQWCGDVVPQNPRGTPAGQTSVRAVVVLTTTYRRNTMQSVVAGQAPITLKWKKYLGKTIKQAKGSTHDN